MINAWEAATNLIVEREKIIAELEAFERLASDPNRFFETGYRGSSVARLKESKLRSQLYMVRLIIVISITIIGGHHRWQDRSKSFMHS